MLLFNHQSANMPVKIHKAAGLLILAAILAIAAFFLVRQQPSPVLRLSETETAFYETEAGESGVDTEPVQNAFDSLSVPTWFTKINETYFLVDCYHNQILFSDSVDVPIRDWYVMTDAINKGHTLASDGLVYLADDTENNRVLVLEKRENRFVHTQTFSGIGNRPHYCIYHEPSKTFYVWSSMSGEMYLFKREADSTRMYLSAVKTMDSLKDVYVRSFTIVDSDIYFVSSNGSILKADLKTFRLKEEFPVPAEISGMIQLTPIDDYFYITVSTDITGNQDYATILRTQDLHNLADGNYEDIYHNFIGGGTPYYISKAEDFYYLTEHRLAGHSLWQFQIHDNKFVNVEAVY